MASLTQTRCTELYDVTAKHSFLKNPDLKAMTFSHLQVNSNQESQCLLNAALTCKDFLEVALDALWEKLDSLVPLLKLLPALQVDEEAYAYVLSGSVSQADWDRVQYYSRKVKFFEAIVIDTDSDDPQVHPSTYFRIAQLLQSSTLFPSLRHLHYNLSHEFISHIFIFQSPLLDSLELTNIKGFENTIVGPLLATLSSDSQMLKRIVLDTGRMSVDILKRSIIHFKQLRFLDLSVEVFMSDFTLWEVLGTLPALADLTLKAIDPESHPKHAPENSNSQSGGPEYFDALESLCVTGSFFFIQDLLGFINSSCLKTIKVYPVIIYSGWNDFDDEHEPDDHFAPSLTIIASKWSRSLKNLVIDSSSSDLTHRYAIPKCMMLLADLHEMRILLLKGWRMESMDDDVRSLVVSWPKLRSLRLPLSESSQTSISLSTLKIIAENCPDLRQLHIRLDTSTIPPFDTSSKRLRHDLEVLNVGTSITQTSLESQIQVARHLDLIFPYLKSIEMQSNSNNAGIAWSGIRDLVMLCQDIRRVQQEAASTEMIIS